MKLVAEYAKRVVVMNNGKILDVGPTRKILGNFDLLKRAGLTPPPISLFSSYYLGCLFLSVEEAFYHILGEIYEKGLY